LWACSSLQVQVRYSGTICSLTGICAILQRLSSSQPA
jgi:hypothetical protein